MFYKEANFQDSAKGKLPNDWETVKLEALLDLRNGQRPKVAENGHIPIFGANGIMGYTDEFLTDKDFTIVFGRVGASGEIHLGKGKIWASDNAIFSENYNQTRVYLPYLFYLLKSKRLSRFASKTTHPIITKTFLDSFSIQLPKRLEEQKAIVGVLGVVDSAVGLVDEVIAKTERLKKGLMQELLTKGIGHTEYEDTPIGKIPREWEVERLGDITSIERGKFAHRPRNEPRFYGGKIPFIQTGDIAETKGLIRNYSQTLNEEGLRISKLFKKGTIVISIAGNIGDVGILNFDSCFPDSVVGISVQDGIDAFFLMYMLQNRQYELSAKAPQSTQKNINLEILGSLKIPIPPIYEQRKIAVMLSDLNTKLELERKEKTKLERIKQGLMDLLLTGRVRVKVD